MPHTTSTDSQSATKATQVATLFVASVVHAGKAVFCVILTQKKIYEVGSFAEVNLAICSRQ